MKFMKKLLALIILLVLLSACGATEVAEEVATTATSAIITTTEAASETTVETTTITIATTSPFIQEQSFNAAQALYAEHAELLQRIAAQLWAIRNEYRYWDWQKDSPRVFANAGESRTYSLNEIDPMLRRDLEQLPGNVVRVVLATEILREYPNTYQIISFQTQPTDSDISWHALFYSPENSYGYFWSRSATIEPDFRPWIVRLGGNWYIA
jgi:hypothetical protein